ncbi:MAG: DinB family protein [Planctomycetes bacterium]|nr:DinB family protein [Planctomycetota bacterium]
MASVTIRLPSLLAPFVGGERSFTVEASTLRGALDGAVTRHPELRVHLFDETGAFRPHVRCFHNATDTRWLDGLDGAVADGDEVTIVQAVSGGATSEGSSVSVPLSLPFDFGESRRILEATPSVLTSLLAAVPEKLLHVNEGKGTWSSFQIVCHMAHGENDDWLPRIRLILEKGRNATFTPFDRERGFVTYGAWRIERLLAEFARLRRANLRALNELSLRPEHLQLEGTHPSLGRVTLEQLVACWITHDLAHVSQIGRVLTRWHGRFVGPWREFFSLLRDRESERT